ncbi:MAG: hypothetical protein JXB35_04390, partial [Anaerolineae bacterium]|nr:hypothetical protein [Anaerolineae bacterium]
MAEEIGLLTQLDAITDTIGVGGCGLMDATAYDTAWLARVPEANADRPAYPQALQWLRVHQRPDGSWGSSINYGHDRIISTLAAVLALARWNHRATLGDDDAFAISRGVNYVRKHVGDLSGEQETIGFEMILPTLLDECTALGLHIPMEPFARYRTLREAKLARIPKDMIYSPTTSVAFSLEFLGKHLDIERAKTIQEPNGSIAVSPSATSFFLTQCPDCATARRYVDQVAQAYGGAASQMFPFDMFETSWSLWNLFLVGGDEVQRRIVRHALALKPKWDEGRGTSSSSFFSVVNADDSAMVFRVLRLAGLDPDPEPLYRFEGPDHFICHPFERDPSTSTNIRVLEALKGVDAEASAKILRWLKNTRIEGRYWMDKWHASPYYPTAHAVIALMGNDHDLARSAVEWILETQRADGTWGHYDVPTAEETAYCLQALTIYGRYVEPVPTRTIIRGRAGLLS